MGLFGSDSLGGGLPTYRKNIGLKAVFAVISLFFVAYLANFQFSFFVVPASILKFQNWIFFASGILILIGIINFFRAGNKYT